MTKDYLDISELSAKLELINKKTGKPANYILRFWEKEFSEIDVIMKRNKKIKYRILNIYLKTKV